MSERFEKLLEQAQTGAGTEWISEAELLEFNEFMARRGFGVSRMEVMRAKGGKVRPNHGYGVTPQPFKGDTEHWMHHFDPIRSAAYIREQVDYARKDGALFDYKVWAEDP
ncbi:MAG: hypothetical protein Q4G24_11725 [Paracoccus sp. (in: a-proteobacteria)]|uniref:hypothetical protein n=1 Tax=Paracoccus sp. TaxID=267 RepID=UPI0026DFE28A|nr:hypothetical protein [Paracoccus sp. (in: a-proteobacteria)]MDO5622125.1 hypothetical protein [Paracoccus sp. (in: a-proteobacteria)]